MNTGGPASHEIDGKYILLSMVAMLGSRKLISEVQDELDSVLDNPAVKVIILYAVIDLVVKNAVVSVKLTFVLISVWLFYKLFVHGDHERNADNGDHGDHGDHERNERNADQGDIVDQYKRVYYY